MNRPETSHTEKHEFALFVETLSLLIANIKIGTEFTISDEKLFHRMGTVLRLKVGDVCILFDQTLQVACAVHAFTGKKHIHFVLHKKTLNVQQHPHITFLLPMLKRDDYESALYALAELGVNRIQLVYTQKTSQQWAGQRDIDRAERILIAAAEQSKNFAYPELQSPISLDRALHEHGSTEKRIFFDAAGTSFFSVMKILHENKPQRIVLLIGPEGDLSAEEKKMVEEKGFIFCALTPTIVRAVQAAALGAGFVRSLANSASF